MAAASNWICLTGGIASGKSRVQKWFAAKGWTTVCTDEIVHELYQPGQPLVPELSKTFGKEILSGEKGINRKKLAEIVFSDRDALVKLNEIVHPMVRQEWKKRAAAPSPKGLPVLVVIPLAYETEVQKEFSRVWVVACSARTQKERLGERGLDATQIEQRIASQWPLQKKIDLADFVIWNNGPWELTEAQLGLSLKN